MTSTIPPQTSTLRDAVAANIRAELARNNTHASGLSKQLKRNEQWLSHRLSGSVKIALEDLDMIANALGCSTDALTKRDRS